MFEAQFWKLLRNSEAQPKFTLSYKNKARNSHKPRLGEYVQQGNIRSITYIVKGVPFSFFIKKIPSKKNLEKNLVLKYLGSEEVENNYFNLIFSNFSSECGIAQLILPLFVSLSELTAWRRETAMLTLVPILPYQLSPDSNRLKCLRSCQYTCLFRTMLFALFVLGVHYTCTVHWVTVLLSLKWNKQLWARSFRHKKFTTHSLTHSLTHSQTPLLEPLAVQAPPGLKTDLFM